MKLVDFIVCDDIRQEVGGKVTLVGVYEDRLMINVPNPDAMRWPAKLKLGFFIRLLNDGTAPAMDNFDLQVHCDKKTICRLSGPLKIKKQRGLMNLFFVNSAVRFPSEGTLSVTLLFKKSDDVVYEIKPDLNIKVAVAASGKAKKSIPPQHVTRH